MSEDSKPRRKGKKSDSKATMPPSLRDQEVITLDIGGTVFRTTRATLKTPKHNHYLARLMSDAPESTSFFVDRSAAGFDYILQYLRGQPLGLSSLEGERAHMLLKEAEFYELPGLVRLIYPPLSAAKRKTGISLICGLLSGIFMRMRGPLAACTSEEKIAEWANALVDSIEGRRIIARMFERVDEEKEKKQKREKIRSIQDVFKDMISFIIATVLQTALTPWDARDRGFRTEYPFPRMSMPWGADGEWQPLSSSPFERFSDEGEDEDDEGEEQTMRPKKFRKRPTRRRANTGTHRRHKST